MTDVSEQHAFAASCLVGRPARPVRAEDVRAWQERHLLLPIADALERHASDAPYGAHMAPAALASARRIAAATDAAERRVIGEVLTTLGAARVDVLLLKGAALAYTVYSKPWLRARADIDVLIRPGDMQRTAQALQSIGFKSAREVSHPLITRQRHFSRTRGLPVAIDVHEELVNPLVLRTLPRFDVLLARAQSVPAFEAEAKALATPDALLHALVHRVAHHNSSADLLWLYDMHLLAGHMNDADWGTFLMTARDARVCRIAADGLQILSRTLGTSLPSRILHSLESTQGEPSAALLGGRLTEWRLQWINFKSLRGVRARLAFVRAHVAPPASELAIPAERHSPLPLRYVGRAIHGARKWRLPISQAR